MGIPSLVVVSCDYIGAHQKLSILVEPHVLCLKADLHVCISNIIGIPHIASVGILRLHGLGLAALYSLNQFGSGVISCDEPAVITAADCDGLPCGGHKLAGIAEGVVFLCHFHHILFCFLLIQNHITVLVRGKPVLDHILVHYFLPVREIKGHGNAQICIALVPLFDQILVRAVYCGLQIAVLSLQIQLRLSSVNSFQDLFFYLVLIQGISHHLRDNLISRIRITQVSICGLRDIRLLECLQGIHCRVQHIFVIGRGG